MYEVSYFIIDKNLQLPTFHAYSLLLFYSLKALIIKMQMQT